MIWAQKVSKMSYLDDGAKRIATLHAAEKRALEMVANGANLCDVLNELCALIDMCLSGPRDLMMFMVLPQECHEQVDVE